MKYKLKHLIFLLLGVAIFGCSEDFLDVEPQAAENEAAFYLTEDQIEQAITAAYSQFNNISTWDVYLMQIMGDIPSDDAEAGGESVTDVTDRQNFGWLTQLSSSNVLENSWGTLYKGIFFANKALEKIPDVDGDENFLNLKIAEAKFIRAINHFYLTMIWGGVPIVDHILGSSEYEKGRDEIKDVYESIEQDLLDAIEVLPERSGWGSEYGRASKGAAKALLGRLYLFESSYAHNYSSDSRFDGMTERWSDALNYSEQVINSGEYGLVGINGETYNSWRGEVNGYRYIWTSDGDNSEEKVFEIQCLNEGLGWQAARGNSMAQWSCSRYYYDEDNVSQSTGMWGFGVPTQDLWDAFEEGDPRRDVSLTRDGIVDSMQTTGGVWVPYSFEHCITNIYPKKWEASYAEFKESGVPWHGAPQNIPLIRISEVYLNAAEAAFMAGDNGKALTYINKVRERARACGTTGVPAALTSVTLEDIQNERRLEFTSEGKRYYDIVRWGIAEDLLDGRVTADGTTLDYIPGQHEFHPLPSRQVYLSGNNLEQYGGW